MSYSLSLSGTPHAQLLVHQQIATQSWFRLIRSISGLLAVGLLLGSVVLLAMGSASADRLLGVSYLFVALWLPTAAYRLAALERGSTISAPSALAELPADSNLAPYLSIDAARTVQAAQQVSPQGLTSRSLLVGLAMERSTHYVLEKLGLTPERLLEQLTSATPTLVDSLPQVLDQAVKRALTHGQTRVAPEDLLFGLVAADPFVKQLFFDLEVETDDLDALIDFVERLLVEESARARWYEPSQWHQTGGFARDFAAGYTNQLSALSQDLTDLFARSAWLTVFGHTDQIAALERALSKSSGANAVLVGEPGVGKKTVVMGLAERMATGKSLPMLNTKHLLAFDTAALLAGADRVQREARLVGVLNEAARSGNTVVYIEDIHNLFGGGQNGGHIGTVDATAILLPYLQGSSFQVIGSTTFAEYQRLIEPNSSLKGLFERVEVPEPEPPDVVRILLTESPQIEARTNTRISFHAIKAAVVLSARYIHDQPFPEKAIRLLDGAAVAASSQGKQVVEKQAVEALVSEISKVPVAAAEGKEADRLLHLEEFLHQRVIGQDEAIKAVSEAMRRARAGIRDPKRPVGSFLFLGPTGVGKTETAKALAAAYFGRDEAMIRLDMSEYQEQASVGRLIGPANDPSTVGGVLTRAVREDPFSLVLLDELEKAAPEILTLFLQVLDDGFLTDNTGRKVDFSNTIIIATSNAGSELIRQHIQQGGDPTQLKKLLLDYLQSQGIFRPEFLNRFDAIVAFQPLTAAQVVSIVELMLNSLDKRLKEQKITIEVAPEAVAKLAQIGFDPVFGARPLRRLIQEQVEGAVAKRMLGGELARGGVLEIGAADIALPEKK